jgi:outer membrane biosynthesis protein TonB
MTRIDSCYAAELPGDPGLGGEMLVKLTIDQDGSVSKVEFLKNELNTAMRACVERVFRKLSFAGMAGHQVVLFVPLEFSP